MPDISIVRPAYGVCCAVAPKTLLGPEAPSHEGSKTTTEPQQHMAQPSSSLPSRPLGRCRALASLRSEVKLLPGGGRGALLRAAERHRGPESGVSAGRTPRAGPGAALPPGRQQVAPPPCRPRPPPPSPRRWKTAQIGGAGRPMWIVSFQRPF